MPPTKFKIPKRAKEKYPIPDGSTNITLKEINGWFTATGPKNDALLTIKPTKETTTRCKINRIYPTGYQGKLLNKWFEICRVAYNHGVKYIKINGMPKSWQTLRNEVTASSQEYFDKMIKKFGITQHIIDQSIVDAHKAYKSSFALCKTTKRKFRVRYRKIDANFSIPIVDCFSTVENAFAIRRLGIMKSNLPIKGTTKACRLKKTAKGWFLYMPTNVPVNDVANRKTVCSSDPGTRTFQTVYSPGPVANIYEFGGNYSKKVKGLLNRIDADNKFKDKPWYSKYLKRLRDKIRHLTEDIQWKTAKYLATNFETVLIGNLSTISCLKGKKLTKMNKRILQSASHYSFRQRLKNKCAEWNSKFVEVDESYTSKTCGGCGFIKEDLEGAKVFDCNKCRLRIGRDVNGARNIMIKKLK